MSRNVSSEDASSAVIGLLLGSIVFSAVFAYVVDTGVGEGSSAQFAGESAHLASQAVSLAALLVHAPGDNWYAGDPCATNDPPQPDQVQAGRFGLAMEDCAMTATSRPHGNLLDYEKLMALEGWTMEANASNGAVDYPEARTALGLGPLDPNFNLRGAPVVPDSVMEAIAGERNKLIKPLYIGDFTAGAYDPATQAIVGTCEQGAAVEPEVAMIQTLVDPTKFDAAARVEACSTTGPDSIGATLSFDAAGDVIPDDKSWLKDHLRDTLDAEAYTVLIVGSNVDHNDMTSEAAKVIEDWVVAGGYLVVLGHDHNAQWMQSAFHVGSSASSTPSPATVTYRHALLTTPNRLDYPAYDTNEKSWKPKKGEFRAVLAEDPGDGDQMFVGLAPYGTFGTGQVLVTSYRPHALTADQAAECDPAVGLTADCAGLQLVQNLVTVGYHGLYIDYGPDVPIDRESRSVTRLVTVDHPNLNVRVPVLLTITVFS